MNKTYALVKEFHEAFRAPVGTEASISTGFEKLRVDLIVEELTETLHAIISSDNVEFVDGLGDLDYVIEGAALTFGMTLDNVEYSRSLIKEDNYRELLGNLIIGATILHGDLLAENSPYPEKMRAKYVAATLSALKANVWELADRAGFPLEEIIEVIHESNMSKLGADGRPVFREDGKILKGPNFFTPTAKIKELLGV